LSDNRISNKGAVVFLENLSGTEVQKVAFDGNEIKKEITLAVQSILPDFDFSALFCSGLSRSSIDEVMKIGLYATNPAIAEKLYEYGGKDNVCDKYGN